MVVEGGLVAGRHSHRLEIDNSRFGSGFEALQTDAFVAVACSPPRLVVLEIGQKYGSLSWTQAHEAYLDDYPTTSNRHYHGGAVVSRADFVENPCCGGGWG